MYKKFKEDVAALAGLAFVIKTITGAEEFSGAIELDFRDGALRNGRPPIPAGADRKELGFLVRPILPTERYSGTVRLGANLGVINDIKAT